jgi:adenine-specific DNA methylase
MSLNKKRTSETNINVLDKEYYKIDSRTQNNIDILRQFKNGDLSAISHYSGFGGLRKALAQEKTQKALAEFLSPREIEGLVKSTSTGYFTPPFLIDFIYQLVQKLGFKHGNILEPACGHGAFFERMPKAMRDKSTIIGIELEKMSAAIAKALYPDIKIINKGFHHFHDGEFDLIIGNPPYASFTVFDQKHADLSDEMIHHYFVAKSARLLKEGGLLAMVVPCYILDNPKRHLRHQIAEIADLIAAYRMPCDLFTDAKVTVDVVIFQRTANPKKDWVDAIFTDLPNQDRFMINQYFVDHPENILGNLDTYTAYSYFEDCPRKALRCVGSIEEVEKQLPNLVKTIKLLSS